jgi:hypothetical protein
MPHRGQMTLVPYIKCAPPMFVVCFVKKLPENFCIIYFCDFQPSIIYDIYRSRSIFVLLPKIIERTVNCFQYYY